MHGLVVQELGDAPAEVAAEGADEAEVSGSAGDAMERAAVWREEYAEERRLGTRMNIQIEHAAAGGHRRLPLRRPRTRDEDDRSGPSPDSTPSGFGGDDRMLAGRRCWRRREATSPGAARWAASPTSTMGGGWERRPGGCGGAGEGGGGAGGEGRWRTCGARVSLDSFSFFSLFFPASHTFDVRHVARMRKPT